MMPQTLRPVSARIDHKFDAGQLNSEQQCHHRSDFVREYKRFKGSAPPSRFLYFRNGSWLEFDRQVFDVLLDGFLAGKTVLEVTVAGICYLFNYLMMSQVDLRSGAANSIAWIDVEGRCFFPKFTLDGRLNSGIEMAGVCNSDGGDRESVVYQREHSDESQEAASRSPGFDRTSWTGISELKNEDKLYKIVEKLFSNEMSRFLPGVAITRMHKCLHSGSHGASRSKGFQFQMEMMKALRGSAEVKFGWFGASMADLPAIVSHGFGKTNSQLLGTKAFGDGVHLSAPQYPYLSSLLTDEDYNGEKHLLLCRVIMGKSEEIEAGSRQFHPSSDEFDSGVDSIEKPKWYIVWSTCMNTHIIPECIVSFRCAKENQGSSNMRSTIKKHDPPVLSFAKLITEMGNFLPSSIVQSVRAIHGQFKEGRITKPVFIRSLRSLVGDKVLASSIKKIRGY